MNRRWQLFIANASLVIAAYWLVMPWDGRVDDLLIALVFAGVWTVAQSWLAGRSYRQLGDGLRRLGAAEIDDQSWSGGLPGSPHAELGLALEDLIARTRQNIGQLKGENQQLEGILESVPEAILVIDHDGQVVMANASLARLFDLERPLVGRRAVEIVRQTVVQDAIAACLASGRGGDVEISLTGGPERHLDVQVAPIREGEECKGVVTVFYDITRLRQLERMRRDFVANVSHELRTPLTAIKGYAETLTDGALDDREAAARFIGIISSHADRLNRLLDDLLDLSRLESEQMEVELRACELKKIVDTCIGSVGQIAVQKRIAVAADIPSEIQVVCDAKLIEQALINLLDNAVKYTPDDGEVRVGTRPIGGERIAVYVEDTGIGIPSDDLGRVFERFYRVDKGRSRDMGGTGLGLAIVRHIAEAHGERISVESALGKGTTFSLALRVAN